jgi:DinB superfamily
MKNIPYPNSLHYALFYENYISKVDKKISVLQQLKTNAKSTELLLKSLTPEQLVFRYAEGKWCIKDILQHIIDIERLMVYRGMNFLRENQTPQPWMDEDAWAISANAAKKPLGKIIQEYKTQRAATICFYKNISNTDFKKYGIASSFPMSVSATAYICCGHELHHLAVMKQKYLA